MTGQTDGPTDINSFVPKMRSVGKRQKVEHSQQQQQQRKTSKNSATTRGMLSVATNAAQLMIATLHLQQQHEKHLVNSICYLFYHGSTGGMTSKNK